jgi:hypothetical protein
MTWVASLYRKFLLGESWWKLKKLAATERLGLGWGRTGVAAGNRGVSSEVHPKIYFWISSELFVKWPLNAYLFLEQIYFQGSPKGIMEAS